MAKFLKITFYNIVFLFLGLIAIELILGNWLSSNRLKKINILTNISNQHHVLKLYPRNPEIIHYSRDQFGLRGSYNRLDQIEILTIGGSTTDQRYLDDTQTWQAVLNREFNKNGFDIDVVNAGLDGQSTKGHVQNFEIWFPNVAQLKANYILVYVGINDFYAFHETTNDDLKGTSSVKSLIKSRSALYSLYQTLKGNYLAQWKYPLGHTAVDFKNLKWTQKGTFNNYSEIMEPRLVDYENRLRKLHQKIIDFGSIPVFVTQQFFTSKKNGTLIEGVDEKLHYENLIINGVDQYHLFELLNQKTLSICSQLNILCFDLAHELRFEEGDFYDYIHNTPQGAEKIGLYLFGKLKHFFKKMDS